MNAGKSDVLLYTVSKCRNFGLNYYSLVKN